MKGSVLRLLWPAPAAKAATRPAKDPTRPLTVNLDVQAEAPIDSFNEITLAVLEEFSAAKTKGYDPYNATAAGHRPKQAWERKRKRD